jgi:hypothetical protein
MSSAGTDQLDMLDPKAAAKGERNAKFMFLVVGIIFFFGCHNYMQELIMSLPGFKVTRSLHRELDSHEKKYR